MNTLEDFIHDFGTDSMEAIVQMVVAKSSIADEHKKTICKMASRLSEALREYAMRNGMKAQVTDFR
jgi:hypothetical protein